MADHFNSETNSQEFKPSILEKKLKEVDPSLFDGIPGSKKRQIIKSVSVTMHKTHIGPLPDPETLSEYSIIIDKGAERIMVMAESQLNHRLRLENKVIGSQITQSYIGQISAFILCITMIVGGVFLVYKGHDISGSLISGTSLIGLATVFIKGKQQVEKSLEEKKIEKKR